MYGTVGSSVTFTWSFSGRVLLVEWGVKYGASNIIPRLVSISSSGTPPTLTTENLYGGRVNGSYHGDASSGLAIFTLSNIRRGEKRFYACRITDTFVFSRTKFDSVELNIQGG